MIVSRYKREDAQLWNDLNSKARNGHFLFDRNYMDYHSDRFEDYSVVLYDEGKPIAIFPANRDGDCIMSHQGLTFGGLVLSDHANLCDVLKMFDCLVEYYDGLGASRLIYKALPAIYFSRPAAEDLYALFRRNARLVKRDVSTTIDYRRRGPISKRRIRGEKKARSNGLAFGRSNDWAGFWNVLSATLAERHGVRPVHTLAEIEMLAIRFPDAIRLFTATHENTVVAGTVIFETPSVAHAQYIASSPQGRGMSALDGLFDFAIGLYHANKLFFDFGISTEEGGLRLNEGLLTQKEEFGGGATVHDVYEVNWNGA